jgi:hypothetical protein
MMKKLFDHKIWAMLAACLALLMLVFLAAGLGNLHFQPGRPISLGESETIHLSFEGIAEEISNIPIWDQVVFWGLVFLMVIIVSLLLSPELRKRIIVFFLRFVLFAVALFYILKKFSTTFMELDSEETTAVEGIPQAGVESATTVFTPPHVSPIFLYIISLGVILVLAVIAYLVSRWWLQRQRLRKASQPLERLAEVTRSSLADISSGMGWEDAIVKCYLRMSNVVAAQRGLIRRMDLTPSEFAMHLEKAGMPGEAVRQLTNLFEAARYGARQASRKETIEAVACLTTILHACGVNE